MSQDDLSAKLRRLGVVKGARELKPAPPKPTPELLPQRPFSPPVSLPQPEPDDWRTADDVVSLEQMLPGSKLVETVDGACLVLDHVYPLSYQHGNGRLADLLTFSPHHAVPMTGDSRLSNLGFRDFLFLDTETTGLAGAGTLAFMVGAAFFEGEAFVVRQYFLRDHGDEPAMLLLLHELLEQKQGVVSFNGRSFDIPLLDGRFLINRLFTDLPQRPHLDLLHPARRLWRARLGSCALSALEPNLLGIERTQEDVPGWLIPSLYNHYLNSGDGRDLVRVFYHNRLDMISMVTLAAQVLRQFAQADPGDHPIDLLSLGKWQADLGDVAAAEQSLRWATAGKLPLELYHKALHQLGNLLKRNGRRDEALVYWQQIAATSFDEVEAHIELAKHYEWHHQDIAEAVVWTKRALALVASWRNRAQARLVEAELQHRLARLQGKL